MTFWKCSEPATRTWRRVGKAVLHTKRNNAPGVSRGHKSLED